MSSDQVSSDTEDQTVPGTAGHMPGDLQGHLLLQRNPGWKKEHQLLAVTSALFLMSLKFISYVGVKSQKPQYLRSTIPISAMLDGLDGMGPKASVPSGADPCLDPC